MESDTKRRLDAFVAKVMEPVPAEALHDQGFNRAMREQRKAAWGLQETLVEMLKRKRSYLAYLYFYQRDAGLLDGNCAWAPEERETLAAHRKEENILLLTPAPDRAALAWKKRHRPKRGDYDTAEQTAIKDEVDRAIAEDEEWLAAHSVRRPNKKSRAR
jgi:hypothetical protein